MIELDAGKVTSAGATMCGHSSDLKGLQGALTSTFSAIAGAAGHPDASGAASSAGTFFSSLADAAGVAVIMLGGKAQLAAAAYTATDETAMPTPGSGGQTPTPTGGRDAPR